MNSDIEDLLQIKDGQFKERFHIYNLSSIGME